MGFFVDLMWDCLHRWERTVRVFFRFDARGRFVVCVDTASDFVQIDVNVRCCEDIIRLSYLVEDDCVGLPFCYAAFACAAFEICRKSVELKREEDRRRDYLHSRRTAGVYYYGADEIFSPVYLFMSSVISNRDHLDWKLCFF